MPSSSTEPAPDSKALSLIAHVHLGDVYLISAFTYARRIFRVFAHLQYVSKILSVKCQRDLLECILRRLSDYTADVSQIFSRRLTDLLVLSG